MLAPEDEALRRTNRPAEVCSNAGGGGMLLRAPRGTALLPAERNPLDKLALPVGKSCLAAALLFVAVGDVMPGLRGAVPDPEARLLLRFVDKSTDEVRPLSRSLPAKKRAPLTPGAPRDAPLAAACGAGTRQQRGHVLQSRCQNGCHSDSHRLSLCSRWPAGQENWLPSAECCAQQS